MEDFAENTIKPDEQVAELMKIWSGTNEVLKEKNDKMAREYKTVIVKDKIDSIMRSLFYASIKDIEVRLKLYLSPTLLHLSEICTHLISLTCCRASIAGVNPALPLWKSSSVSITHSRRQFATSNQH